MTKRQPCEKRTVDSVVNLLLPSTTNGKATFKEYSLEKLRELQSKLALISGKQSSSGQDDVDKFGQVLFQINLSETVYVQILTKILQT